MKGETILNTLYSALYTQQVSTFQTCYYFSAKLYRADRETPLQIYMMAKGSKEIFSAEKLLK